jgi:hypothetical protein
VATQLRGNRVPDRRGAATWGVDWATRCGYLLRGPGLPALASLEGSRSGRRRRPWPSSRFPISTTASSRTCWWRGLPASSSSSRRRSAPRISAACRQEGKIGHAEMRVGDTIVMLADASTAEGVSGPMPATVVAYVEDCEKVYQRALRGGSDDAPRAAGHVLRRPQRRRGGSAREPPVDPPAHRGRIRG